MYVVNDCDKWLHRILIQGIMLTEISVQMIAIVEQWMELYGAFTNALKLNNYVYLPDMSHDNHHICIIRQK